MEPRVGRPAPPESDPASGLETTAVARAARLGKTVDQLLKDDRASLLTSAYPSRECFYPHEVEQFARGDLAVARMEHAHSCEACAALLVAAQSWEQPLDVFLDEVRGHKASVAPDEMRAPLTDALVAGGPITLLALLAAGVVAYRWDAILSISLGALGWTPVAVLLIATVVTGTAIPLGVIAAKKLGLQSTFAQFGGAAIAGFFALFLGAYGGSTIWAVSSNYQLVQNAEDFALGIVASRIESGSINSEPVKVPAFASALAGLVIAEPRKDSIAAVPSLGPSAQRISESFEIYWDEQRASNGGQPAPKNDLGTVYVGHIEKQPDGKFAVKTSKQTIEVSAASARRLSTMKGNERVFAIVPANETRASRVLSIRDVAVQAGVASASR